MQPTVFGPALVSVRTTPNPPVSAQHWHLQSVQNQGDLWQRECKAQWTRWVEWLLVLPREEAMGPTVEEHAWLGNRAWQVSASETARDEQSGPGAPEE